MPKAVCPKCNAEVASELLESGRAASCAFCGADLPRTSGPTIASSAAEAWVGMDAPAADRQHTRPLPPLPEKSKLQVIESTPERLILLIPGGGAHTAGMGLFALIWIGGLTLLGGFGHAIRLRGQLFPMAILGILWATGVVLAYFWMKMKYERTLLLLEAERIVVQKSLFRRTRNVETRLASDSRAVLAAAYYSNEKPVHSVEIRGPTGIAKFGTPLSDAEKDWLVDRINEFRARLPVSPEGTGNGSV